MYQNLTFCVSECAASDGPEPDISGRDEDKAAENVRQEMQGLLQVSFVVTITTVV